jgi:hypothetical protein
MLHPVGPLRERTYWRRRSTLLTAVVVTVVLVKGVLLSGGNSDATTPRPASSTTKPTCPPRSLKLLVGSARDSYRVGTVVDLTLSVLNLTDTTCRAELEVPTATVYDGRRRLWSSNDCDPARTSGAAMRPGELRRLVVRWSGETSGLGGKSCGGKRVGAGRYTVVGRVGSLTGLGPLVLR